jgi:hypothetical protein
VRNAPGRGGPPLSRPGGWGDNDTCGPAWRRPLLDGR